MRAIRCISWGMVERIVADGVMVNLALVISFIVRFLALVWIEGGRGALSALSLAEILRQSFHSYFNAMVILTPLCLLVFFFSGFYTHGRVYRSRYRALVIFQAVTLAYLAFGAFCYLFFRLTPWVPRTVWVGGWLFTLVLVGGLRLVARLWRSTVWTEARIIGKPEGRSIRNVLVIGGAGYIGSVLVHKLLDRGYHVIVLDALLYGDEGIRSLEDRRGFEFIHDDMRNVEAVIRAMQYTDAVIHLGALVGDPACALDEKLTLETNLAATRMIVEAARAFEVRRFIFASTCSVYGASDIVLDEGSVLNPLSLYARTKLASERVLLSLRDRKFAPIILRFATAYGMSPRPRFDLVVNLLTAKAVSEGQITIFGGDQWRPFAHVSDIAEAIILCLESPLKVVEGQIFNVGSNEQNYRIAEIGRFIKEVMPEVKITHRPDVADKRNYRVSFAKIRKRLAFMPHYSIVDGIKEIKKAIESGVIKDYRDARYSNYKTLSEESHSALLRHSRTISLYSVDEQRAWGVAKELIFTSSPLVKTEEG